MIKFILQILAITPVIWSGVAGYDFATTSNYICPTTESAIVSNTLISEVNDERTKRGLGKLEVSNDLKRSSYCKASHMIEHDYWAHTSPDGVSPFEIIKQETDYRYAGENLARGFFGNSQAITDAWMDSKLHREAMLNPKYDEAGFTVLYSGGKYITVGHFKD